MEMVIVVALAILGAYLKGRSDGAERVRRDNRELNQSRRKP